MLTRFKQQLMLSLFAFFKVPLLTFCFPRIKRLDEEACTIFIALGWFTKNHLGSMYFGVLMMGADLAGGLLAIWLAKQHNRPVSIVFKDTQATFLKRAEFGVHFHCQQGKAISELINQACSTNERQNVSLSIQGICNKHQEVVAEFNLTLSVKAK